MLGGMQFGVLVVVEVLFCEIDGRVPDVVRGARCMFCELARSLGCCGCNCCVGLPGF